VYFYAADLAKAHSELLNGLREEIPFPFEHKLYAYFGSDCFAHLASVTSGLDSMIIAESEIQRQVKQAYEKACLHYALASSIHYLFQKSLKLAKYLRSKMALPHGHLSIPKMIFELSSLLFTDVQERKFLFIGNSEINRKVLHFCKNKGVGKMTLCTRSMHSALEMGVPVVNWDELSSWGDYDVVVAGTNASAFLVRNESEKVRTRCIFDLGVPRNVDPGLSRDPHISLFNIDELGHMLEKRQSVHAQAIKESEGIIQEKVRDYMYAFKAKILHAQESAGRG
jgi:glutamyl-tRNA reductase